MKFKPQVIFFVIAMLIACLTAVIFFSSNFTGVNPGWNTTIYPIRFFLINIAAVFFSLVISLIYRTALKREISLSGGIIILHILLSLPFLLSAFTELTESNKLLWVFGLFVIGQCLLLFAINRETFMKSRSLN